MTRCALAATSAAPGRRAGGARGPGGDRPRPERAGRHDQGAARAGDVGDELVRRREGVAPHKRHLDHGGVPVDLARQEAFPARVEQRVGHGCSLLEVWGTCNPPRTFLGGLQVWCYASGVTVVAPHAAAGGARFTTCKCSWSRALMAVMSFAGAGDTFVLRMLNGPVPHGEPDFDRALTTNDTGPFSIVRSPRVPCTTHGTR